MLQGKPLHVDYSMEVSFGFELACLSITLIQNATIKCACHDVTEQASQTFSSFRAEG